MIAHAIKDGKVVNTIEVESLEFITGLIDASMGGSIGDMWDGEKFSTPEPEPKTIEDRFTELKTEFESYIYGHYGPATQMTMIKAYSDEDTPIELKAKAKEVGDWIKTVQTYYKNIKASILSGAVETTWDFQQFDATKPQWDFEDFV